VYHDPADGGIVGNLKSELTTEVVLTGWPPGEGRRSGQIGSLLLGAYRPDGHLVYIGHVGTGFTGDELRNPAEQLEPLRRDTSPFDERVPVRSLAARSGSSRAWSARSSTAPSPATTGSATRPGVACARQTTTQRPLAVTHLVMADPNPTAGGIRPNSAACLSMERLQAAQRLAPCTNQPRGRGASAGA
jgi:ATP dependent DNA ligase C terminal region